MDWLYRVFYTVLSLGMLMLVIAPIILLLRFLLSRHEKKYVIWGWRFVYLRSICPIALSSPLCMIPAWNRRFHLILSEAGLALEERSGVMNSWKAVFEGKIATTAAFRGSSIIWLVGAVLVLVCAILGQVRLHRMFAAAKPLGENIFESAAISLPVQTGLFKKKIYLPEGMMSQEMSWTLKHMEQHNGDSIRRLLVTVVSAIHWFNPVMWLFYYLWSIDEELAADEKTIYRMDAAVAQNYAQTLLNITKTGKSRIVLSLLSIYERGTEKRAYKVMYQKWDTTRDKLIAVLKLSVFLIWLFLLVPIQIAWSGGTWGAEAVDIGDKSLFGAKEEYAIAKTTVVSPEGLDRVIQLNLLEGDENESGYDGSFELAMYDSVGNHLASKRMDEIFPEAEMDSYHFSKGLALCAEDYNNDGVQELVLGQKKELKQSEFEELLTEAEEETGVDISKEADGVSTYQIFFYSLVNIEDKELETLCDNICVTTEKKEQNESVHFEVPADVSTIFTASLGKTTVYYVWNEDTKEYQLRQLSEKELETYQNKEKGNLTGQTQEHTLEDSDGATQVLVTTKRDSTNSEAIQSVVLSPRNRTKKFQDVQGYYCDLFWAPTMDDEKERYAMMIFNGSKSQTFIIYDTKRREVYYRHEDGTDMLQELFKQYNEEQITFEEKNPVIYDLTEKKEDNLRISFAVNADDGVAIKGSYEYDVEEKVSKNLTFSRTADS